MEENVVGEIVDERTGEIIPKGANALVASSQRTNFSLESIGTLELTPEAEAILNEPLDENAVLIRPDGMVYLPWTFYAKILNKAFGRLRWGQMPQGSPMSRNIDDNTVLIVWGNWLVIRSVPISFAYGETTYKPSNQAMSYGDACEGAKSSALARCCKQLGIALQLWDSEWVNEWREKHAETYPNPNQNARQKYLWRKKATGGPRAKNIPPKPAKQSGMPAGDAEKAQDGPNGENPGGGETTTEVAQSLAKGFLPSEFRLHPEVLIMIKNATKMEIPAILGTIKKLDATTRYTAAQVIEIINKKEE